MSATVDEWVTKAEEDYSSCQREAAVMDSPSHDVVYFLAQQCVEKLMKALLVQQHVRPPMTHDLVELAKLITGALPHRAFDRPDLRYLAHGAVTFRYPGAVADSQDAAEALAICTRLREQLLAELGRGDEAGPADGGS